ncbi:MAG: HlyD family efflux transporter periplasmic adaptor subunit [Clostridia bacterium]
MRRKRITGRFYVFLALVLIGGYFVLRELIPDAAQEAVVTLANDTYSLSVDALVVRDEVVTSYEGKGRIVYTATEGQAVKAGDPVCEVYSAGYSEKEMEKLESVRQQVRAYHETILDNIVDTKLDALEAKVEESALKLKSLIANKTGGSLLNLEKELEQAMMARQEYLRQNRREDPKLNELYDRETKQMNAISSWRTLAPAPRAGLVSFYLDGYEDYLTVANLASLTASDVKAVLAGKRPETTVAARLQTNVFRVVSNDKWYMVLMSSDAKWNPISGQEFTFQLEGFPDVAYAGTAIQVQKTQSEVLCVLEINGALGPMMNRRSGKAAIGVHLSGMSVPLGAVATQGGQSGVWLLDATGGTFVPVEVLSSDSHYALVSPLTEGTLAVGQRVQIR